MKIEYDSLPLRRKSSNTKLLCQSKLLYQMQITKSIDNITPCVSCCVSMHGCSNCCSDIVIHAFSDVIEMHN